MMEEQINDRNLIEQLRAAFPELESRYQERVAFWGGEIPPSNYDVFGSVFSPRFTEELEKGEITEFLRRSATFIERVCAAGDAEAINVLWIKVLERLIFRPKEIELLWTVLGPTTKATTREAARRWSDAGRRLGRAEGLPETHLPSE
jgi:hypothetical protein